MFGLRGSPASGGHIACQYLHFARTEDMWLKSALKVEKGVLLTSVTITLDNVCMLKS